MSAATTLGSIFLGVEVHPGERRLRAEQFVEALQVCLYGPVARSRAPRTLRDFRGLAQHLENWTALASRLPAWSVRVVEKPDPHFLTRWIQERNPAYRPTKDLKLSKWIVLDRKEKPA